MFPEAVIAPLEIVPPKVAFTLLFGIVKAVPPSVFKTTAFVP